MKLEMGKFVSQKALPRRTFLRGIGATIALPLLDAMVPAFAADRAPWTPRLGFVYVGNGIVHKTFKLTGTGTAFEFSPVLKPLAPTLAARRLASARTESRMLAVFCVRTARSEPVPPSPKSRSNTTRG